MKLVSINSEVKHPRPSKRIVGPPYVPTSTMINLSQNENSKTNDDNDNDSNNDKNMIVLIMVNLVLIS